MKTLIIAEAGVNHNGSLETAFKLVDAAVSSGADIVKFQTFKASKLVTKSAGKAAYQQQTTGSSGTQLDMLRKLELSPSDHFALKSHCESRGIEFLSTPFDEESLDFLVKDVGIKRLKIPSGEITNAPFLLAMARHRLPVVLSTGMCDLSDIETALGVLAFGLSGAPGKPSERTFKDAFFSAEGQHALRQHVTILHCTTEYPAPPEEINLRAMDTLRAAFGLPVGYSDHSAGITITLAAAAREATIIEKHFTLDRDMEGPDHKASLEPGELAAMVSGIREIESALGSRIKAPTVSEWPNRALGRKSLVAAKPIAANQAFDSSNVAVKRPGTGLPPIRYWDILGTKATRAYEEDEALD